MKRITQEAVGIPKWKTTGSQLGYKWGFETSVLTGYGEAQTKITS